MLVLKVVGALWVLAACAVVVAILLNLWIGRDTPPIADEVVADLRATMCRIEASLYRPQPVLPTHLIVRPGAPDCVYIVERIHDERVWTTEGCEFERSRLGPHHRPGVHTLLAP